MSDDLIARLPEIGKHSFVWVTDRATDHNGQLVLTSAALEAELVTAKVGRAVADAARVLDMHKLAHRLAPLYRKDAVKISDLCDETLDPSGALLGFVRDAALRSITEASHEA